MGFMDLFKKKKNTEEKSVPTTPNTPSPSSTSTSNKEENIETSANDNSRFTLVVEDTFQLLNDMGTVIVGFVHGEIKVGDAVYIMSPNGQITLSEVSGIEIGPGNTAQQAKDENVGLKFSDIKDKSQLPKYTVITSIRPQTVIDVNQAVENGQLLGLLMEYNKFNDDREYISLIIYAICHAHFIAPIYINKEPISNDDGSATFTEGTNMSFISLIDPKDETKHVQPVFTDWNALSNWKDLFNEEHPAKSIVLKFQDVVSLANKMSGMVINPFGPVTLQLSNEYISKITNLEGYKREFSSEKSDTNNVEEIKVEKDTKVMVGIPTENDEVRMIRETVIAIAETENAIREIQMLIKVDEQGECSYFLIVDCDDNEKEDIFNKLSNAISPYLVEVKYLDMITLEKSGKFSEDVAQKSVIYNK